MVRSANLGFPRIGARRELKKATESFWRGAASLEELLETGRMLRERHWRLQQEAGVDIIPSNDFSFYDQMLDMSATVGAVPPRFDYDGGLIDLDLVFAMARGAENVPAMEMTKWFDTNYHYIAPEFYEDQEFELSSLKPLDEYLEAKELDIETRPVLIGPVTYLSLGKAKSQGLEPLSLLDRLLPVYSKLLGRLKAAGAEAVQIDEPILALDLTERQRAALRESYETFAGSGLSIMLATYFDGLRDNLKLATELPAAGVHIDLARAPLQLAPVLRAIGDEKTLSLGLVDGRNVWCTDLSAAFERAEAAVNVLGSDRVHIAPSCSLLHSPVDLDMEALLDPEIKSWMAYAKQKLEEAVVLTKALNDGKQHYSTAFQKSDAVQAARQTSNRIHNPGVKARLKETGPPDLERAEPYEARREKQRARLTLPDFPTTTIGSFPQTRDVRRARAAHKRGELSKVDYDAFLKQETAAAIRKQETLGLDVLVHGEFERNDMVEYFGELLDGFAFTKHGWVQSFGSRYVKPPVIFGDVSRPAAMTVLWSAYAQSLTEKPVKGMLTGPVTILQWSFVRDDQPRSETCKQIALAVRDEVADLEKAGIGVIQIDEPALREGLPLREADRGAYLEWAVDCFRLASAGAHSETQIHTHMCYSEFNDIMPSIAALDADVISIETSRSDMELLNAFSDFKYPNEIGPGVWDIHSPRTPSADEMELLLSKALEVLSPDQLWVNPDCGLKTRDWPETEASLAGMVEAAGRLRSRAH